MRRSELIMFTHIGCFFIKSGKHFNGFLWSLQLIDEMVGIVFVLLSGSLVLVLELHLSNVSFRVDEIDGDIIKFLNLLFNAYNLNSWNIFE